MMDPSCKGSESEEMSSDSKYPDRALSEENQIKTCADCGTSKTPLWRGGPAGPKSLCNACGIRSRKKRRTIIGGNKEEKKSKRRMMLNNEDNQSNGSVKKFGDNLKRRLMEMEMGMVMQRPRSTSMARSKQRSIRKWRKMGEEEQAAVLLMALSCGSVYA